MARSRSSAAASTSHRNTVVAIGIVIAIAIASVIFSADNFRSSVMDAVDPSDYQAIHLDSGKTYFGKVSEEDGAVTITDVFYFLDDTEKTLVKTTKESLIVDSDDVLSTENLESDSAIVKAITKYFKNKN